MGAAIQNQPRSYRAIVNANPMGAVRMTQNGKWTSPTARRYLQWKTLVGYELKQSFANPLQYALDVKVTFTVAMPVSWSRTKKLSMLGQPVTVKPDLDNMVKAIFDAANKIAWTDDNLVVRTTAEKVYGYQGKIELEVIPVF